MDKAAPKTPQSEPSSSSLAVMGDQREGGTEKLEEAVKAFREALKTVTAAPSGRHRAENLDRANALLAERRGTGFTHP